MLQRLSMLVAVGVVLAACAGTVSGGADQAAMPVPDLAVEPAGDAAIYGGFAVDPPAPDEVVLTLVGARTVELTMRELEDLADRDVTFIEPFVQAEQTFRAVALADLLDLAGIVRDDAVDTIALNDYRFRDDVSALLEADALLAVGRDGGYIPMDAGGPIRLVFDASSLYHGHLDAWNWSLRSIEVVRAS